MTTGYIAMNQMLRERYQSQVSLCKMAHGEPKLQWLNITFA